MLNSEHRTIKVEPEIKISEVDKLDWENCLIYVNGTQKDKDYILKDNDSVIIRQYPSSTTAIFVGLLLATAVVVDLATGKGLISYFIKNLFKQDVNDFDTGNTEQIPTISGAKNRSGANQPIPLLIGESMYTPITASQYYTDIDPTDGTDGENQYFHGLYCLGYKDVDLKSVSMGIYKLSDDEHNGTGGSLDCTNVDREVKTKNKALQTEGVHNFNRGQTSVSLKVYADTGFTLTSVNSLSMVNFMAFAERPLGYIAGRTSLRIDNVEIVNKKIVVTVESIPSNSYLVVTGYAIVNITETADKSNAHYKTSEYHQQLEIQQTLDENEEGSEVSLYPQKVVQENLGTELMHPEGANWLTVLPFSAKYPQKIQLEVQFQNLVKFTDEGGMDETFVTIGCAYSTDGGLTFSPFPAFSQTGGDITITDEGTGTFSDNSGTYRISKFYGKKNKTMRFIAQKEFTYSEVFDNVKNNIVEFRIFRINEDLSTTDSKYQYKCFASAIRTWCYDYNATKEYAEEHPSEPVLQPQRPLKAKYRDMTARLGFTIKSGDEIKGTLNELNVIYESRAKYCTITENNGVKTYTWSTEKVPTNNPASLALMVLEHEMRGEYKYDNTSLDYESFGKFYEWCQQTDNGLLNSEGRKYTANGVISKQFKTLDLVNQILACGHGKLTIIGNKYGVLFDKPLDTPVLLMNNQNILERKNTKNFDEDIDGYACRFIDCLNDYQEDTQIFVPDSVKESKTPDEYKLESIELPWITDAKRAYRMCMYQLACRKLRPESWEIKMGVDGAIADVGSLVAVQDDTILVGIGDGAQITELITNNNYITGIKVDYGFNVTDITKTYAVQIQHVDSVNGINIRTYQLEDFSTTGVKDTLMFDEPIPTNRTVKPAENDIVSFGIHGMVSNDAIVMSKKENQDGTYTFVCVPYQSNIYDAEYGEIPDFVSNVTPPRDNGIELGEEVPSPTYEDVKVIAETVAEEGTATPPSPPTTFDVTAYQDYIELKCTHIGTTLSECIKYYEFQITKGSADPIVIQSGSPTFDYVFKRNVDGFPEASNLQNWSFKCRVVNVYDIPSSTWVNAVTDTIDVSHYGTWQPATPTFTSKIPDEGGIVFNWSPAVGANSRSLYGTNTYEVKVYYDGTLRDTISTVETNCVYNFNRSSDGYPELTHSADYTGLDLYTFTLKAINNSGNDAITTAQSFSQSEKADYGTWIPSAPAFTKKDAERDGFNIEWNIPEGSGSRKIYGGITYRVDIDYNGSNVSYINTDALRAFYSFDRSVDLYPEKHINVETGDRDLSLYTVKIKAINTVVNSRYTQGSAVSVNVTNYLTWKLPTITVQDEVVDRTAILTALYNSPNIYGTPRLKVRIKRIGNLDEVEGEPFNDYLGITADSSYYTPNFEDSPQPSTTSDTETNYRTSETDAFISTNNKVTQTLPLLGQCPRIFNDDGYVMMTYLVPNEATEPANPQDGQVMRYVGQTTTDLENGKYYQYNLADDEWVEVISKTVFVPTIYKYELQLTNESGNVSNIVEREITALCTSIADVVHSHEHYKDLYVEKLSAINANLGMISQGGMGDFDPNKGNYWALSNLTSDDTGIPTGVKKGAFRVGGEEQYFKVTPLGDDKYDIELKAGNITLTSSGDGTSFREGTYIYDSTDSHKRLWLTPTGIVAQIEVNRGTEQNPVYEWENLAKVLMDSNGNVIITNSETQIEYGIQIEGGDIYHFDSEAKKNKDEDNANPQSITVTGSVVPVSGLSPILDPTSSATCIRGTVEKSISSFTGRMVFFSKSDTVEVEGQKLIKTDGSIRSYKSTQYNELMTQTKDSGTVGSYLGLSESQISNEIFINIGE